MKMTDQQQHPIYPTPLLIKKWRDDWFENDRVEYSEYSYIATRAAQWGADQELEACIQWLVKMGYWGKGGKAIDDLSAARRPKPMSLKEQALKALDDISIASFEQDAANTIRFALEQLDD